MRAMPPKRTRSLLAGLLLVDIALILYMGTVGGLSTRPVQALPLLYWLLLLLLPVLALAAALLRSSEPLDDAEKKTYPFYSLLRVCAGCLMVAIAVSLILASPQYGGTAAFTLALGSIFIIDSYAQYRRAHLAG